MRYVLRMYDIRSTPRKTHTRFGGLRAQTRCPLTRDQQRLRIALYESKHGAERWAQSTSLLSAQVNTSIVKRPLTTIWRSRVQTEMRQRCNWSSAILPARVPESSRPRKVCVPNLAARKVCVRNMKSGENGARTHTLFTMKVRHRVRGKHSANSGRSGLRSANSEQKSGQNGAWISTLLWDRC